MYPIIPSFNKFYLILLSFTEFLPSFTKLYLVLLSWLSFLEIHQVVASFT